LLPNTGDQDEPSSDHTTAAARARRNADTDQLAKAVEAANNKLIQDGTVQEILDKYNGGLGAVDKATIVPPLS
jgi:ABC-type amino acid transport substrate-binding protein